MSKRLYLIFLSWGAAVIGGGLSLLASFASRHAAETGLSLANLPLTDRLLLEGNFIFQSLFLLGIVGLLLDRFVGLEAGFWSQIRASFKGVPEILTRVVAVVGILFAVVNLDFLIGKNLHLFPFPDTWHDAYEHHVSRRLDSVFFGMPLWLFNACVLVVFFSSLGFGRSRRPAWEKLERQPDLDATLILDKEKLKLSPRKRRKLRKAERYLEKGKMGRAARIFEKLGGGYLYRAGKLYDKINRLDRATKVFARAGEYFVDQGKTKRAGDAFFHAGCLQESLDAYASVVDSDNRHMTEERLTEIVKRMGEAMYRLGRYMDAGDLLMRHRCYAQAGECFEKAGEQTRAAEAYSQAGDLEASTKAFADGGRPDLAEMERGKWLMSHYEYEEAAKAFEAAGNWPMVGEAWAAMGDVKRAAQAYYRDGNAYDKAAELFLEAGDHEMAMKCYSQMGEFEKTAQLAAHLGFQDQQAVYYEKAGLYLQAARSYLMIGEMEKARACFAEVSLDSKEEARAAAQVIAILAKQGRVKEALTCGESLLDGKDPDQANAAVFHAFAGVMEKIGRTAQAADVFIRVAKALPREKKYVKKAVSIADEAGIPFQPVVPPAVSAESATVSDAVGDSGVTLRSESQGDETSLTEHTLTLDDDMVYDLTHDGELQRYEMIQELGRGGMGIVYKARDRKLNRLVAFKMLHPEYNRDPKIVLFFKRETRAIASLNHPNIVTLFDVGYQKGCFYMVMEFVHGMNMERLRKKHPTYVRQNILGLLYETCFGLKYAHDKGIIHRDLKPSNLMVTKDGRVKIMDFGLAKKVTDVNQTQQIWGTPVFMAPEVLQGERASFLSDIYSLGATLYTLVTGVPPFAKEEMTDKFVGDGLPIPAHERVPSISKNLSETISKCLYLDPRHRYQDLNELLTVVKLLGHRKKGKSVRRATT